MTSPDTNTLNGSLEQLGITMADNLVSMGVTGAAASDGLTTLAGKILDIEPSIGGLDLDTAITLSASSSSIISGQSVIFTSKLTASYDDETVTDVDLSGVLTGATVVFYDLNGVSVGSGVTDSTGVATATVSNLALGSHTIKAVFEGTDNFHYADSSTVSVTVTNPAPDSMTLVKSAGKQILSYKDVSSGDEFCTVTATVYDANNNPLSGETVTFEIAGSTVKSDETDGNGQVSYTYNSSGAGDVIISAECGLLSETYTIEDCINYDSLTSASGKWTIPSGVSSTYSSDGWRVSANAYTQIKLTDKLTSACSVEFTLSDYNASYNGRGSSVLIYQYTNGETAPNQQIMIQESDTTINVLGTTINRLFVKGAVYRIEYTASTISVYENDVLLGSASNNIGFPTRFEFHMGGNGRYAQYKDVKVKPL